MKAALALAVATALWMGATAPGPAKPSILNTKEHRYHRVDVKGHEPKDTIVVAAPMPNASVTARSRAPGQGFIVDGQEAQQCQFPYQVALVTNVLSFCGGSLIHRRWVLTAAHCLIHGNDWDVVTSVTVYLGSNEWRSAPYQITANRFFFHGAYDDVNLNNDIALIDLGYEVPLSDCVKIVTLETSGCGDSSLDAIAADVSGWGAVRDGMGVEDKLRWVQTRSISNNECASVYNLNVVIQRTLCSMPTDASSAGTICSGDSGGPLVQTSTGRQVGINSFTSDQGCQVNRPSGYVRVPCYASWLQYVMEL